MAMTMRQTLEHLEPCDVFARNECDNTEQGLRRLQHYAHAHVFKSLLSFTLCFVLFLWILVSRCHWCRTPQRLARWFPSSTAFHHAYATPSAKFFPSGCCSPIVSWLNLYPKFLHISHRENGSFEVLSLQSQNDFSMVQFFQTC